jgi:uncharacterized protein (DUF697 family)
MPEWIIALISLVAGIFGGAIGAYAGMLVGMARLEVHKDYMRERMDGTDIRMDEMKKRSALWEEDVRILDFEMEDVMRNLQLQRKKRQNWRFNT